MGVLGLIAGLAAHVTDVALVDLTRVPGNRFAVDASWLIHQVITAHAKDILVQGSWVEFRQTVYTAVVLLLAHFGGKDRVVLCLDGLRVPGKLRHGANDASHVKLTRVQQRAFRAVAYSPMARARLGLGKDVGVAINTGVQVRFPAFFLTVGCMVVACIVVA